MNETNGENKMTKNKDLKKVKVIKVTSESGENQRHYQDCDWLQFDENNNWLGLGCDCRSRANAFAGWKISDLSYCYMEATNELTDKRLMARSNKNGLVEYFCNEGCKESHFKNEVY